MTQSMPPINQVTADLLTGSTSPQLFTMALASVPALLEIRKMLIDARYSKANMRRQDYDDAFRLFLQKTVIKGDQARLYRLINEWAARSDLTPGKRFVDIMAGINAEFQTPAPVSRFLAYEDMPPEIQVIVNEARARGVDVKVTRAMVYQEDDEYPPYANRGH